MQDDAITSLQLAVQELQAQQLAKHSEVLTCLRSLSDTVQGIGSVTDLRRENYELRDENCMLKVTQEQQAAQLRQVQADLEVKQNEIVELEKKKAVANANSALKGQSWEDECLENLSNFFFSVKVTRSVPKSGDFHATIPYRVGNSGDTSDQQTDYVKVVIDAKNKLKLVGEDWDKLSRDVTHCGAKFGILLWSAPGQANPLVVDPRDLVYDARTCVISDSRLIGCNVSGLGRAMSVLLCRNLGDERVKKDVDRMSTVFSNYASSVDKLVSPLFANLPSADAYRKTIGQLKESSRIATQLNSQVHLPFVGKDKSIVAGAGTSTASNDDEERNVKRQKRPRSLDE